MRIATFMLVAAVAAPVLADDAVRGYTRRDGAYVAPHQRTEPNTHRYDNYSSQGNTNPYTGQAGSQRNEFSNQPAYNYGRQSGQSNPYANPYGSTPSPAPNPYSNPYGR